jgi:hypothetical protein
MTDTDDTQVGIAPDAPTLYALAWGDEAPTEAVVPYRRPLSPVLLGLFAAVMISAAAVAAYVIGTGHTLPPLRIAAPPTTTTVIPPAVMTSVVLPTITAVPPTVTETETATPVPAAAPPTHHAPAPAQASSAQDEELIAEMTANAPTYGARMGNPALVIGRAHAVCQRLAAPDHPSLVQVANEQQARYPENAWGLCSLLVVDAHAIYCPDA